MKRRQLLLFSALFLLLLLALQLAAVERKTGGSEGQSVYGTLEPDDSQGDPLAFLNADFTPKAGFSTNLPIAVLRVDRVLPRYDEDREEDWESDIPRTASLEKRWGYGTLQLIDTGGTNSLSSPVAAETAIRIRRRGHSSMNYDKPQYSIKTLNEAGEEVPVDLLGMGAGDGWILNGSMADKSMLRNYLAYRVASEVQPETPDCRFCEVFLSEKDGALTYQGVYLLMERITRGETRIDIDASKRKNVYTSYIVRRDRYNQYDTMLDTWGRKNGMCPEDQWIGVKYPGKIKQTEATLSYITQDFSKIEKVLYSEDPMVFKTYGRYLDVNSFVDYFLLNEFFGNYDSGEHSTIMWKNTGGKLHIGPVWDFDQAMNNVYSQEQDPDTLAMTEKPFFAQLLKDKDFLDRLTRRYASLRRSTLSEEHIFALMEEAESYLRSASQREWFRWAEDYLDGSGENPHNYYLEPYKIEGVNLNRFNADRDWEKTILRAYLRQHGRTIPKELQKLYDSATVQSGLAGENGLLLLAMLALFGAPAYLVNRRAR